MDFFDVVAIVGGIVRFFGLLVFGVAAGWFTLYAYRQPEKQWQLQIAVFLGFFLFAGLLARYVSAGGLGGFTLGAGGALLFWGLKADTTGDEPGEEE